VSTEEANKHLKTGISKALTSLAAMSLPLLHHNWHS